MLSSALVIGRLMKLFDTDRRRLQQPLEEKLHPDRIVVHKSMFVKNYVQKFSCVFSFLWTLSSRCGDFFAVKDSLLYTFQKN